MHSAGGDDNSNTALCTPKAHPTLSGLYHRLPAPVWSLLIAVAYLLLHWGLAAAAALVQSPTGVSPWYPPAGLALALLLIDPRFAVVVFLARMVDNSLSLSWPQLFTVATLITLVYTGSAVWLRRAIHFDVHLPRIRDLFTILVVAMITPAILALAAVSLLYAFGYVSPTSFASEAVQWWVGDAIGIITVVPLILTVIAPAVCCLLGTASRPWSAVTGAKMGEALAWLLVTLGIIWLEFSPVGQSYRLLYLIFVPLLWVSLRYGLPGASVGVSVVILGTIVGVGVFGLPGINIFELQLFLLTTSITTLVLGIVTTARHRAEQALSRERAFLSSAIEILPFPIVFNTPESQVLQANQASYRFFGVVPPDEWWHATLLTADTRAPVPPPGWPMMRAARGEVVSSLEGIMVHANGREVPVLAHAAPIYLDERLVATVVAFQDISALKEADRAKDRFLAVLSHELRTPLTSILGWAQEAEECPEVVPQALAIIRRNARRQRQMLEDLLDVSRLIHGKLFLRKERAELGQLAQQGVEEFLPIARERHITLQYRPADVPLPVEADPRRIAQVISNLIDNALKFTELGGTVTITARRSGAFAEVDIHDTGCGIPPEVIPTLFNPFTQPDRTEAGGGLGLGLALVRGILELHGGGVTVSSAGAGRGSTFTISLPLAPAPAAGTAGEQPV